MLSFVFNWWDQNHVSEWFEVVEELVFNSDNGPERSSDCLLQHAYEEHQFYMLNE